MGTNGTFVVVHAGGPSGVSSVVIVANPGTPFKLGLCSMIPAGWKFPGLQ